jgi:hypothetical protein
MAENPAPVVTDTITVTCPATGPQIEDIVGDPYAQITLADVEAWCAELRRLGAPSGTPFPGASGLTVQLAGPVSR